MRWPAGHRFLGSTTGRGSDPQLVAETLRQAGMLVAHVGYHVTYGHALAINSLTYEVDEELIRPDARPSEITVEVVCREVRMRAGVLRGVRMHMALRRGAEAVGVGQVTASCVSRTVQARLRGAARLSDDPSLPRLGDPVQPALVGRDRPRDVLLSAGSAPGTWVLRAERDHPVLYDHPLDHVSAMAAMEAMRQAAQLTLGLSATICQQVSVTFLRYIEHDEPCLVTPVEVRGAGADRAAVTVRMDQRSRELVRGLFVLEEEHVLEPWMGAAAHREEPGLPPGEKVLCREGR